MTYLTPRQREVLDTIKRYAECYGFPPTVRELGEMLGIKSTNGVNEHLRALEKKGAIVRFPGRTGTRAIAYKPRHMRAVRLHVERQERARRVVNLE